MSKTLCHALLHYSVARLSWKTIKSLRRSRLRRTKRDGDDAAPRRSRRDRTKTKSDDDVSPVDYEILQGWTLVAFHSLYVALGVERCLRLVVPFYFHLKTAAVVAAFVAPSWAGGSGGGEGADDSDSGLGPLIPYCFDRVIVPGVQRVHVLLDRDPAGWAWRQLRFLPFWIIDSFVLPGVLSTDEERQAARRSISEGRIMPRESDDKTVQTPPRGQKKPRTASGIFNSLTRLSPAVQDRLATSAMTLKRFSREHDNGGNLTSPRQPAPADAAKGRRGNSSPIEWSDKENRARASPLRPRRRSRRERRSAGDHFREIVTGDPQVRVIDHLFDLDLSLVPSQQGSGSQPRGALDKQFDGFGSSTSGGAQGDDHVTERTKRRSTRLAKKKVCRDIVS